MDRARCPPRFPYRYAKALGDLVKVYRKYNLSSHFPASCEVASVAETPKLHAGRILANLYSEI